MIDIVVLIVTYGSPGLFDESAAALDEQRGPFGLSVFVEDNSPDEESRAAIRTTCRRRGFHHRCSMTNTGFAAGISAAREESLTTGASMILVLNPDAVLCEGTIARLLEHVDDDAGIVVPVHIDEKGEPVTSVHPLPTPLTFLGVIGRVVVGREGASRIRSSNAFRLALGRTAWRRYLPEESTRKDLTAVVELSDREYPSGACWLLPSHVFDQFGGFDQRFFLYCEDADFVRRLRVGRPDLAIREVRTARLRHVPGGAGGAGVYESPQIARPYAQYLAKHFPRSARLATIALPPCLIVASKVLGRSTPSELASVIRSTR